MPRQRAEEAWRENLEPMESLHDPRIPHWDHEPLRLTEARSGPRVCDPQPTRFAESMPAEAA